MNHVIKGKAGGFFTPQEEGGKCKLTILFEDRESQDAAFLLRYQDILIGKDEGCTEIAAQETPLFDDNLLDLMDKQVAEINRLTAEIRRSYAKTIPTTETTEREGHNENDNTD